MKYSIFLIVLIINISLSFILGDLPVHCEFPQVKGKWRFEITTQSYDKTIINYCQFNARIQPSNYLVLDLQSPNVVKGFDTLKNSYNYGTWTLISDQAFEIIYQGKRYFSYFNYTELPDGKHTVSHCNRILTGTYHDDTPNSKHWGCFRGQKIDGFTKSEKTISKKYLKQKIMNSNKSLDKKFKNDPKYIEEINKSQKTWKATSYKFLENLTENQIRRMGGATDITMKQVFAEKKHINYMKRFNNNRFSKYSNLPENFDWRNVSGINYVSPVRDQAHCGSCYIFSTMAMLESRTRIATHLKDQKVFSVQEIINCGHYGQGCEGGFGYLISKYAFDYGVVEEKCEPYVAKDEKCKKVCTNQRRYGKNYYYLGGYYGAGNEHNMMEEIYQNGPIVVGFIVYKDLRHYHTGVYQHYESENKDPQYLPTNHAVVITGWGVENGVPYWNVKNSWNQNWGDHGYFKIIRGVNNCNIESKPVGCLID